MAALTFLYRLIGFGGVAFIGLYIADWGVPGASRIPYLSSIPILGDLTTGRAHTYAADQVKIATAGMVEKFKAEALQAQLDAEREANDRLSQANAELHQRTEEALQAQQAAQAKTDELAAEADKTPGLSRPSQEDRQWLSQHGL